MYASCQNVAECAGPVLEDLGKIISPENRKFFFFLPKASKKSELLNSDLSNDVQYFAKWVSSLFVTSIRKKGSVSPDKRFPRKGLFCVFA